MAKPLNRRLFGNDTINVHKWTAYRTHTTATDNFIGGEGVWDIKVVSTGSGYMDWYPAWQIQTGRTLTGTLTVYWQASTPELPGGVAAYGQMGISMRNGGVDPDSIYWFDKGSGYIQPPKINLAWDYINQPVQQRAVFKTELRNITPNVIGVYAIPPQSLIPGQPITNISRPADIVKQISDKKFYLKTIESQGVCILTTGTVTTGTCAIFAEDSNKNVYWVTKIQSHNVTLYRKQLNDLGPFIYKTNDKAKWTFIEANGTDTRLTTTVVKLLNW